MLSAENSTLGRLSITLQNYEQNASSREKPMLMVELIYTALSISQGNFEVEEEMCSMYMAATQMFHLRTQHHKRASTMRARTVTLWQGGLNDQMLAKSLETEISGMISRLQKVEKIFSVYCWNLLRDSYAVALPSLKSTLTGDIDLLNSRTNIQKGSLWLKAAFQSSASGYNSWLLGLLEVCLARRLRLPRPIKGHRGGPPKGPLPPGVARLGCARIQV